MAVIRFLAAWLLIPALLAAQQPPGEMLKPANGTLAGGFQNVSSLQELQDGRVVLSDQTVGLFGVGSFVTGRFEPTPNVNIGPFVSIGGDTLLMYRIRPEWIFFVAGKPIGMLPADNPVVAVSGTRFLYGADSLGHVLIHGRPMPNDSNVVILLDRGTAAQDTVASYWDPQPAPIAGNTASADFAASRQVVYTYYEQARLAPDGWVAVLRAAPYRVDWRSPDGRWTRGAPIPVPVITIDDREKRAYMVRRANGGPPDAPETILHWPATIPPFSVYAPLTSPDGKFLVRRTPSADHAGANYDVINRRGELERQITMPANEHIVGFGLHSVYVGVNSKDGAKDGPQVLERHPWP